MTMLDDDRLAALLTSAGAAFEVPASGIDDILARAAGRPGSDDRDAGDEPAGDEPAGDEPAGDEPAGDEPAGDEPAGDEQGGGTPG
ncbi:MAG TPA: hypothetical protein VEH82_07005, partial [Acidimicrobiales bacterium]|nr:hypothetical protein [Acidimicrobiales bacterium]